MLNPVDRPISTPVTTQADKIATKSALPVEHPEPITVVSPAPISPLTPEFVPEVTANDFSETPVASAPKGINSPARSASAPANAIADEFAASTFESLSFDESLPMSPSEIEAVDFNDDDFNAMLAQSAARFDEMDLPTP
jgi:hypothetical protein